MPGSTEKLYEQDSYLRVFEATVTGTRDLPEGQGVVLDRTAFFPEGGGQPSDWGLLGTGAVRSVVEDGNAVVHVIDFRLQAGDRVNGSIDWERRFDHMQQHSGQHLLSQAFVRILDAETIGFHLGIEDVTIDLRFANLSVDGVRRVEAEANGILTENRNIQIRQTSADRLDSVPLRRRPALSGTVRIVEIKGYDWSLCCGTHVRQTGEIGIVKILRWENHKGGTRVHFACGARALRDHQVKNELVKTLTQTLTAGETEIADTVVRWKEERKASERRIQVLLGQVLDAEAEKLLGKAEPLGSVRFVSVLYRDRNSSDVQELVRALVQRSGVVVVAGTVADRATLFFARSENVDLDVRTLVRAASEAMEGRGGGNPAWAQCSTVHVDKVEAGLQRATAQLKSLPP